MAKHKKIKVTNLKSPRPNPKPNTWYDEDVNYSVIGDPCDCECTCNNNNNSSNNIIDNNASSNICEVFNNSDICNSCDSNLGKFNILEKYNTDIPTALVEPIPYITDEGLVTNNSYDLNIKSLAVKASRILNMNLTNDSVMKLSKNQIDRIFRDYSLIKLGRVYPVEIILDNLTHL